ncbi:MAG: ABC transporter ATP-binding protein, partial [Rhizonema sp. PD38]|nr:ABC transporter ATP-binding protein [Rhizonema sp. PD38]
MNRRIGRAIARISYLPKTLHLVWTASKGWMIAWAILLVIQGLMPVAMVYLTRSAVDGLVAVMGVGATWQRAQPIIVPAAAMGCILLLGGSLQNLMEWVRTAQSEFVHDHITTLIHQKSVAVDYAFYESSEYYDH